MLYEVEGDLINDKQFQIFCHQTNCKGVMGAGIAKQIADKYPFVQYKNSEYCRKKVLGTVLPVPVERERICVNIYGQDDYGREAKVYTGYNAFKKALDQFAERLNNSSIPRTWKIGFPFRIGCGHGHASWTKIRPMIEAFAGKVNQDVYIVRKGNYNE